MSEIEEQLRSYYDSEVADRVERPLGVEREAAVHAFIDHCRQRGLRSVLEVGCGAGRDGRVLAASGLNYRGLDLSSGAVAQCQSVGLAAETGSVLALPYDDDGFDAVWTMSTLMHLPADGMELALKEIQRVVRAGGVLELGVWGADVDGEWIDPHGRYFRQRTDDTLRSLLSDIGDVVSFDTWDRFDDGGHYQRARVVVSMTSGYSLM